MRGRRGKFEHADGGTLFLDEVSDLSMAAQAKLLRAIQDLTVERVGGIGPAAINTRIVAATNRPLSALVDRGLFRTDLFYRLSGVDIRVPPLRQRKGDILELAQYFLARHEGRGRLTMTPAAVDALIAYDWPGNVRELERMIEGAIATAESRQIRVDDLPVSLRGGYARAPGAVVSAGRLDARMGQPLRAAGARKECRQQAAGVPGARHQLPHVEFLFAISAGHAAACATRVRRAGVAELMTIVDRARARSNWLPEASGC